MFILPCFFIRDLASSATVLSEKLVPTLSAFTYSDLSDAKFSPDLFPTSGSERSYSAASYSGASLPER